MTKGWWVLTTGFVLSVALTVVGLAQADSGLVVAGLVVGVVLFLTRRYLQ